MIFTLIAEGLSTGALVALVICGVAVLAVAIFGTVLRARDTSKKTQSKRNKNAEDIHLVEEKKDYDFTNLTEEEKDIIRKHRNQSK